MKPTLKIFVAEDCPNCATAREIAEHIEQEYPNCRLEVIDIADKQAAVPDAVFATPTFMLNDRIVSLGNPALTEAMRWVEEAMLQFAS